MQKLLTLVAVMFTMAMLSGCGSESATTSASPAEPESGIIGTVKYTGASQGNILVFVTDTAPQPNQAPQPQAMREFSGGSGEFAWDLGAGSFYIASFFAIGRPAQGPPLANEPWIQCNPITVKADETVKLEIVLTDQDAGGKMKDCVKK